MLADWDDMLTPEEAFRLAAIGAEREMPSALAVYLAWLVECDRRDTLTWLRLNPSR
jgi:hypothetical protein